MKVGNIVRLQKKHLTSGNVETAKIETIKDGVIILDRSIQGRKWWVDGEKYLELAPKKKNADSQSTEV